MSKPKKKQTLAEGEQLAPPDGNIEATPTDTTAPEAPQQAAEPEQSPETAAAQAPAQETDGAAETPAAAEPAEAEALREEPAATPAEDAQDAAPAPTQDESAEASQPAEVTVPAEGEAQSPEAASIQPAAEAAKPKCPATEAEINAVVEAILFTTDSPLAPTKISSVAQVPLKAVKAAIVSLNKRYEQAGAAFRIEEIAGGFQMMTLGEFHEVLSRLLQVRADTRLSSAAMETLAIIAYRQPILRADIEAIRGVASGEVLRGLMEKQLVKIVGRAEVLGRPMLYGTSKRFLEVFGLASLEDLPRVEELKAGARAAKPVATPEGDETEDEPTTAAPAPAAEGAAAAEPAAESQAKEASDDLEVAAGQPSEEDLVEEDEDLDDEDLDDEDLDEDEDEDDDEDLDEDDEDLDDDDEDDDDDDGDDDEDDDDDDDDDDEDEDEELEEEDAEEKPKK